MLLSSQYLQNQNLKQPISKTKYIHQRYKNAAKKPHILVLLPRLPEHNNHANLNPGPAQFIPATPPNLLAPGLRQRLQVQLQHQPTLRPPHRPPHLHPRRHHAQRVRLLLHDHVPRGVL